MPYEINIDGHYKSLAKWLAVAERCLCNKKANEENG